MRKAVGWALLWVYLAALLRLTVFRDGCFSHALFSGKISLMPGMAYRNLLSWGSYREAAYLFFGNIACFVPLGWAVRWRGGDFWCCLLCGLALSLLIEAGQFVLGSGLFEVDDLLLNTIGAMLGGSIFPGKRRRNK